MGFWQNLSCALPFKPMPLDQEWIDFTLESFPQYKKGPVQLTALQLFPEPILMRRYISPQFLRTKIEEITDLLVFLSSEDSKESMKSMHLYDEDSRFYGNVTITVAGSKSERKPGLFIKIQDHMDEAFEFSLRSALKPLLEPLKIKPEIGFSLTFRLAPVHPKWKTPERFKELAF